jgi:photosystem II stability/assembly factor-like uncharacterized protein
MLMSARSRFCKHLWIPALLLIAAMPRPARAGEDAWTPFGAGEGPLQSLTASSRGELYVTADFALTEIWQLPLTTVPWRWRNNGLGQPLVTALTVDPKNPSSLWAASGTPAFAVQSIYHSNDGGGSWTQVFTGDLDFQVAHLWVVQAKKSVILLAETGNGAPRRLLRSANGGVSWTPVQGALGPVAAPPDEPNVVFASSADGLSVVRSTDGALTFHSTGSLPTDGDFLRALHATYGRAANVFASFESSGLFRSTDQGGHWSMVGFLHSGPSVLASEPKVPSTIYAANFNGLFASQKNGKSGSFRALATFVPPQPIIPQPTALAAAPGGPYFLAGPDLYRYLPKATHGFVAVAKTGIESFGVAELRFHAADPSLLAVREYTGCIRDSCDFRTYLSSDSGKTFQRLSAPLPPNVFEDVSDFAFDPVSTHRWLMAVGGNAVLTEIGDTRTVLPGPVAAVEISAGGILLAGGANGVQASQDDGATWQTTLSNTLPVSPQRPLGGGRRIVDLVVNPFAPERVIARALETTATSLPLPTPSDPALYYSSDAGRTWTKILDGSASVAFVAGSPSSLYLLEFAAGGVELRRSDDGGATTQLVHTFTDSEGVDDVATDPSAPQDLYAASGNGVLQSHDGGVTWEPAPGDFNAWGSYRQPVSFVQVHPTERGHLFASPGAGGLFENQLSN